MVNSYFQVICLTNLLLHSIVVSENCAPRKDNVGRKCQKPCVYEGCKSKRKECLCDGDCGMSCINKNLKCEEIEKIKFGNVQIIPYNRFAAIAKYTCDEGYELQRKQSRIRVCQGDGKWSLQPPECRLQQDQKIQEKVECGVPPTVNNAHHDGDSFQTTFAIGTMVQYTCNEGTSGRPDDVPRAWCVHTGLWVGPNMTCGSAGCPRPRSIDNGRIVEPFQNSIGDRMTYECHDGFYLTGRRYRTCLSNGTWDGQEPSCETVTCSAPPRIMYATHDGFDETSLYPAGRQVTYTCISGYRQNGGRPRAMCSGDGEWVGLSSFSCSPVNCEFPIDIPNGWREGHSFEYKSQIVYKCQQGYRLEGSSILICEANGKWEGVFPSCKPVECPHLSYPKNGNIEGSGNAYGTLLEFKCKDGFKLTGSVERRCQENGMWSGTDVACKEVDCGWPGPFYNGFLLGQKTSVGSTIFFSCDIRTNFVGDSLLTKCLENGTWSHPPPQCLGQCMIPSIPNATLDKKAGVYARHGEVLNYECEKGLVPDDSRAVTCDNGTWTSFPRCTPASCRGPPPHVHNGLRIFEGLKHGDRAKYICRNGYRLVGIAENSPYLTCNYGTWGMDKPKCKEFYCRNPAIKPFQNGVIYKQGNSNKKFIFQKYIITIRHGTRIKFKCNQGFIRKGPSGATCVNGTWSPSIDYPGTKCVKQNHPIFPKLWKAEEEKTIEEAL